MALILNIDTATERGSICLGRDGRPWLSREIFPQKDHAALAIPAVREILQEAGCEMADLQAVALSGGPGSYTGIRVAAATAKGLCYALDIPLIAINTLKMMAAGIRENYSGEALFCPMIDARRRDVFTALYDAGLAEVVSPAALTLDEHFLEDQRDKKVIVFGTGKDKARELLECNRRAWEFPDFVPDAAYLAALAERRFLEKQFEDLAYFEPFYLKSFYMPKPVK